MTTGNFIKKYNTVFGSEELVDFLMWCIEYEVDLDAIQGDIISLYRKHQHSNVTAA